MNHNPSSTIELYFGLEYAIIRKSYYSHSLASFRHCMIHPCSYVSGNNRAAPTVWAYGVAGNQNDDKALTEGEARNRAEERSGRGAI